MKLAFDGFFLSIADFRRLFIKLALFELANDAFFFNHTLEALEGFVETFRIVYINESDAITSSWYF